MDNWTDIQGINFYIRNDLWRGGNCKSSRKINITLPNDYIKAYATEKLQINGLVIDI